MGREREEALPLHWLTLFLTAPRHFSGKHIEKKPQTRVGIRIVFYNIDAPFWIRSLAVLRFVMNIFQKTRLT
jgi:hypothetical protein